MSSYNIYWQIPLSKIFIATLINFPAGIYLLKVNNRNIEQGKKYVQS